MPVVNIALLVAAAFATAFVSGSNDGATLVSVNTRTTTVAPLAAMVVLSALVGLGPFLVGTAVATTVARGLVAFERTGGTLAFLVAVLCALAIVFFLSHRGMPTSVTLALTGTIVGAGVGFGLPVHWTTVGAVLLAGLVAPLGAGLAGYVVASLEHALKPPALPPRIRHNAERAGFLLECFAYGSNDAEKLVAILVEHLQVLGEAALVVESMLSGEVGHEEVARKITELEHRGDELRASLVAGLSKALVTPIDREDIYRLSRSIDDALDGSRDFVREWDVFRAQDPSALLRVLKVLQQAIGDMEQAVQCIVDSPDASSPHVLAAQRSASRVRVVHEDEIAKLFEGELSMRVIRQRELLHRLDAVGLHLVRAGQILADGFVKRGQ